MRCLLSYLLDVHGLGRQGLRLVVDSWRSVEARMHAQQRRGPPSPIEDENSGKVGLTTPGAFDFDGFTAVYFYRVKKMSLCYARQDKLILRDLDELVQSCRDQEARSYIAEAVICYKAGAFRGCIVATWIAVVFDLIAKIRELSLSGDAEAQTIIRDLTTWQPLIERGDMVSIRKSLELEREIVNVANDKFGFFDGIQILDLKRLQDDRNRCAHPTFQGGDQPYSPSSELARTHLVHAVSHVLSQPPVQGKAGTEHILKSVRSEFFPTELEAAKTQLRSAGLERPKDSLVRSVADHLVL
jgi:hypothetical protein